MLQCDPNTGYLPAGEHDATLDEVEAAFATNYKRREIFKGLTFVVERLLSYGVTQIWIDGSFTTAKPRPHDVDVVYEAPPGADTSTWGLLSYERQDQLLDLQKVDLWPHPSPQTAKRGLPKAVPLIEWFSTDNEGRPKGIVRLLTPDC